MREDIKARRIAMLDADGMGTRPKDFIPILARKHEVSEDALWRDWGRRRSWMGKLARLNENMSLVAEELNRIGRLKRQVYRMARDPDSKPHQRRLSIAEYRALVVLDLGLRGIAPIIQGDIILPSERVHIKARLEADRFFDMMSSVSPRLTKEWSEAALRMPESLEREKLAEMKEREKYR